MRNTFSSLRSKYHLPSKAFESDAVEETQRIKAFFPPFALSHSSPRAGSDRSGWWVGGGEKKMMQGKKVRMTFEDMLWLLPWLDSAGLIMDGLRCWQELSAKSQRRLRLGCLLAMCAGSSYVLLLLEVCVGVAELHLGFEMSVLTGEFNHCFSADALWLTHFLLAGY